MGKLGWAIFGIVVSIAVVVTVVPRALADNFHFGFGVDTNPSAKDVGLPYYPGSWPHKKDKHDEDESAANVWGSFGFFGMKIVAVSLDSNDAPGKVASFYWQPLRQYGPVLDCSAGKPRPPKAGKHSQSLDCSDDHPGPGHFILKSGIKKDFHLVAVEPRGPNGQGSKIALVFIRINGVDD